MKKQLFFIAAVFISVVVFGQKKPKIQGNKIVVDIYNTLEDFNAIEISDDLKVSISQTERNGYHLKTDENLAAIIKFDIVGDVLKIYTLNRITSSKKLEIDITVTDVNEITLKGEAELKSMNRLQFEILDFTANDDSSYNLDLECNDSYFVLNDHSKGDLLLRGGTARMVLNKNAFLEAEMALTNLDVNINERSDIELKGEVEKLKLTATGTTDIKAKKLRSTFADLIASNKSDIYVYASTELKLYAQGKSYIYVYGNPNIVVDGLNDKSQIIKK